MSAPLHATLLDDAMLQRLSRLKLRVRRRFSGRSGTLTSPRAGMSLEFAEYKEYRPGDDFRYVDWKLYGRFDRLFVKVFTREEDVPIYLLLDTSRSMRLGQPSKMHYAVKLAAAVSYLALKELHRVGVFAFSEDLATAVPPRGGLRQVFEVFHYLQTVQPTGATALCTSLHRFADLRLENGLAIVLGDLLSEEGYEMGLRRLLHRGFEIVVLQILTPEDLALEITDDATLRHSERPLATLPVGPSSAQQYQRDMAHYLRTMQEFCFRYGIEHQVVSTQTRFEDLIFRRLRGVLFH